MRRVLLVVLLLGTLVLSAFPALGQAEAAKVIVLIDPQPARPGGIVSVTVHAFEKGVPVDPTSISVRTEQAPSTTISVSRVATGVYSGQLEVPDAPQVTVRAVAEIAGASITTRTSISIEHSISIKVSTSTPMARPGQVVNVSVETFSYGESVDPNTMHLEVLVRESLGPARQPVPLALGRIDVGRYGVDYEVPQGITHDASVSFSAEAWLGSAGVGKTVSVLVDFPEPLEVWYHTVQVDESLAIFEIYVANRTGSRVAGAFVSVAYAAFPRLQGSQNGSTGIDGAVRFEVPMNGSTYAILTGTVVMGSDSQEFRGVFSVPTETSVPFEIRRENPLDRFFLGEKAVLRYTVRENGTPLAGVPVYYYVYTRSEMIASGSSSTSDRGEVELQFDARSAVITVDLVAEIAGSWVTATDRPRLPLAHRLSAQIEPPVVGDSLHISGTFPSGAGPWTVYATVTGLSPASARTHPSTAWMPLSTFGGGMTASGEAGATYEFSLPLPRFLPVGGTLTLELNMFSQATGESYGLVQVFVLGGPPGDTFAPIFAILLAGIVLSFVAIYVIRRRGRAPFPSGSATVERGGKLHEPGPQPPFVRDDLRDPGMPP